MDNPTREELQRQYDGLESTAMIMAAQGLSIPTDVADQLKLVRARLDILGAPAEIKAWTSWLGTSLEGFTIQERLSTGSYCNVFRALNENTKESCVFKIAKSGNPMTVEKDYFAKQAVSLNAEIFGKVDISPNLTIEQEYRRLQNDLSGSFVPVISSGYSDGCFYYRMPFLAGQSFKELMLLPDMPFLTFAQEIFARLCIILEGMDSRHYHGNLQPDNIFITKTDIILLSPGKFDLPLPAPVPTSTGASHFMITTPAYYPFLEANDLFSLGCIFWEAILKSHPLAIENRKEKPEQFAQDMRQMLEYRKSLNHEPLWQFLKFSPPRESRGDLSDRAETFMMKTLKLAYQSDGLITGAPGFKKPSDFAAELATISRLGLLREDSG